LAGSSLAALFTDGRKLVVWFIGLPTSWGCEHGPSVTPRWLLSFGKRRGKLWERVTRLLPCHREGLSGQIRTASTDGRISARKHILKYERSFEEVERPRVGQTLAGWETWQHLLTQ